MGKNQYEWDQVGICSHRFHDDIPLQYWILHGVLHGWYIKGLIV